MFGWQSSSEGDGVSHPPRTQFSVGSNGISVVLDRRDVSQGQTVVISASHVGNGVHGEVGIRAGPLAPCLPVPVPSP